MPSMENGLRIEVPIPYPKDPNGVWASTSGANEIEELKVQV
jgi:hypothetical protein